MIYVDAMMACLPNARWPYREACHLFCDVGRLAELHRFARNLGLKREWFQEHKDLPHYDLNRTRREAAVKLGVIEVDRKTVVAKMNDWRTKPTEAQVQGSLGI